MTIVNALRDTSCVRQQNDRHMWYDHSRCLKPGNSRGVRKKKASERETEKKEIHHNFLISFVFQINVTRALRPKQIIENFKLSANDSFRWFLYLSMPKNGTEEFWTFTFRFMLFNLLRDVILPSRYYSATQSSQIIRSFLFPVGQFQFVIRMRKKMICLLLFSR